MNYDSANGCTRVLGVSGWPRRLASQAAVIAREIHAELKRLNHGEITA